MPDFNTVRLRGATAALLLALATAGCQQGNVNVETNSNAGAANTNAANSNTAPATEAATIEASEPDQYRATLVFTGTAEGQSQAVKIPVDVARSGDNRRYAFNNLPVIGQLVLLDRSDKRYLIIPQRRQYAELTPELLGFDFRSLTPAQIVAHLRRQQGVERAGEEQHEGRTVVRYRYAASAQTQTQAGAVRADSYFLVDKDTGLPVHAELTGRSTGNVQGVNTARLVADMQNIQTTANPSDFEVPADYQRLSEEQLKQQAQALASFLQFVLGQMQAQGTLGGAPPTVVTPSPATTASPAAGTTTASPTTNANR
ncbi:MAG TPA: hypothetical protein VK421_11530 [Pyrinomonadaceae bacterium]|nr:hypothetical protein [Pyrinomonadaceae bacterium]